MLHTLFNWIHRLGDLLLEHGWNAALVRFLSGLFILILLVVAAVAIYWSVRVVFRKILQTVRRRHGGYWPEVLLKRKTLSFVCYLILSIVYLKALPYIFEELPGWIPFMGKTISLFALFFAMRAVVSILWSGYDWRNAKSQERPIALKGLIQFVSIVIYFFSAIIAISILAGKSPLVFIGGLSAASAVLMLVFKDSITGLVAGVQLSRNDMVRIGDWITMPGQGVDGTVIDISLTTVKVKNFDLTVIMVPAYLLITQSVQNWRGLQVSGGRRMMRTVYIDQTTVCFCTGAMLQKFMQANLLKDFIKEKRQAFEAADKAEGIAEDDPVNARMLTNLDVFMQYLDAYLRRHPRIRKDPGFTLLVRQLQAEDVGMPIQMYCYTDTAVWVEHENIVGEIMTHVVAMLPWFGLGIYERSAQPDRREFGSGISG